MKSIIMYCSLLLSFAALSYDNSGTHSIAPKNNMYIGTDIKEFNFEGVTKEDFHDVIDKVELIYRREVEALGEELEIVRYWDDGTVNAYANRRGGKWRIIIYGGLARHESITKDGLSLVMCHEMGHHLGGYPKKRKHNDSRWSSAEGQADYYGALKCLRRIFKTEDNISIVAHLNVPNIVSKRCASVWPTEVEIAICKRTAMAGHSLAGLLSDLSSVSIPEFQTPDSAIVFSTEVKGYPSVQCRLDTFFAAALCSKNELITPTKKRKNLGLCTREESNHIGSRPQCWFRP